MLDQVAPRWWQRLHAPAYPVRSDRTRRPRGRPPVRTRRWVWCGKRAQASTVRPVAVPGAARRRMTSARSVSSGTRRRRSIPRPITWWSTPGASRRAGRGTERAGWHEECSEGTSMSLGARRDPQAEPPLWGVRDPANHPSGQPRLEQARRCQPRAPRSQTDPEAPVTPGECPRRTNGRPR